MSNDSNVPKMKARVLMDAVLQSLDETEVILMGSSESRALAADIIPKIRDLLTQKFQAARNSAENESEDGRLVDLWNQILGEELPKSPVAVAAHQCTACDGGGCAGCGFTGTCARSA